MYSRWLAAVVLFVFTAAHAASPTSPSVISRGVHEYPDAAKGARYQGTAVVRVQVLKDGSVGAVKLASSSGHRELDDAAIAEASRWTYAPAHDAAGKLIVGELNVEVDYTLSESDQVGTAETPLQRLGRIWTDYAGYRQLNDQTLKFCDTLNVSTAAARKKNAQLNAGLDQKLLKLEAALKAQLASSGVPDTEAHMQKTRQKLEEDTQLEVAATFQPLQPAEQLRDCEEFLEFVGEPAGSFQVHESYDELVGF